jgi:hypothetical protein
MFVPASSASAAMYTYDGTDPAQTPCAADAVTLPGYPKPIMYAAATQVGTYEVRYSPSCGTNWLRVNNWYSSGYASVRMIFGRDGNYSTITDETANGVMWTPQVYAPGSTCVAYQVFVTRTDGSYSSLGEISPGLPGTTVQGGYAYRQC